MVKVGRNIKHIWFDLAGTLYQENPDLKKALGEYSYKVYSGLTTTSDWKTLQSEYDDLYKKHGSRSAVFRSLGKPDDYWQKAADDFDRTSFFAPDNNVLRTLEALRALVPISLFTNFQHKQIQALLGHLEIPQSLFTHVLSGDDVTTRKPDLEGFRLMIEKSQLPAEQILYVGDREKVDIQPAKTLGMQTCMLYGTSEAADYCFSSFEDLLSLF